MKIILAVQPGHVTEKKDRLKKSQRYCIKPVWGEAPSEVFELKSVSLDWCPQHSRICRVSCWNFERLWFQSGSHFQFLMALTTTCELVLDGLVRKWCHYLWKGVNCNIRFTKKVKSVHSMHSSFSILFTQLTVVHIHLISHIICFEERWCRFAVTFRF